MLIFSAGEQPKIAKRIAPKEPKMPIWSRRPENYSGEELIEEALERTDILSSDDPNGAWIRRLADELRLQIEENRRLQNQAVALEATLKSALIETQRTRDELWKERSRSNLDDPWKSPKRRI